MLNVLLGMSVLAGPFAPEHFLVAGGIGVYVAGITWLARNENARQRPPCRLAAATLVMMAGIAAAGLFAALGGSDQSICRSRARRVAAGSMVSAHGLLGGDDRLALCSGGDRAGARPGANGRQ